jgi:mxaJ protein
MCSASLELKSGRHSVGALSRAGACARSIRLRVLAVIVVGALPLCATDAPRVLRVAADPNNLPFSNDRGEGFENRLAELVARELEARLEYVWWPQRRGFFRETLGAGRADLVMGVPAGFERVAATRPYYRSTYVFVQRRGNEVVRSLDDPRLKEVTVGVQLIGDDSHNAPPAHALSARGIIRNVRGFTLYGDYGHESPPADIIKAVARGEIDVALAWGPMAGFFAQRQAVPLTLVPISPEGDGPAIPFTFSIAMGVRRGDAVLQREVDAVLQRCADEIAQILTNFGVPLLPVQDENAIGHELAE